MSMPPLRTFADEAACRAHFESVYCAGTIAAFDGIQVRFRKSHFDHCFFESSQRNQVKDTFSDLRAQRVDWIQAALQDPAAELYEGWDRTRKRYDKARRVCVVCGNYVVVIALTGSATADFITAYVADTANSLAKIRTSPRWK